MGKEFKTFMLCVSFSFWSLFALPLSDAVQASLFVFFDVYYIYVNATKAIVVHIEVMT